MGAQDFLEKPVDSEELLETIEKLLNLAKTENKSNLAPLKDISSAKKNKMIGFKEIKMSA